MFLEKLLDFPDIGLSSFRSGDFRSRSRSNSGEFYGIRPYYSGDDIARVDWKKSTTGVLQIREYETDTDQSLLCIIQNDPTLFFWTEELSAGIHRVAEMISLLVRSSWPRHMSGRIVILSDSTTGRDFPLPKSEYELQELLHILTSPSEYTATLDIWDLEGSMVYIFHGTNQPAVTLPLRKDQLIVDVEIVYPMNIQDMNFYEATTLSGTHLLEISEYKTQIHLVSANYRKAKYRVGDSVGEFLQRTLSSWNLR